MRRRDFLLGLSGVVVARHARPASRALVEVHGTLPSRIRRVFVAGSPAAVLLYTLAPERMIGWPMRLSATAQSMLAAPARDLPMVGRLAGRGSTVSVEALAALQPDLILDAGTVDANYRSTAQRVAAQTGLPYVLVDGRLADSARQLLEVGALLGVDSRAQRLAAYAVEVLAMAAQQSAGRTAPTPGVYLARGADGLETALAGSINGEVIAAAGGRNVADVRGGVARVSLEQLLTWNPDWIVTQDPQFFALARSDSTWRSLAAVREDRTVLLPGQPFGWLDGPPGVNRLLGVRWLAARLHRTELPAADTLAQAQQFHQLFYGHSLVPELLWAQFDGRA